jgi:hypothetical protein
MGNRNRGKARAATWPRPAEPSSDPAAEQALDQHIEDVLDHHLSGEAPVPPAETFTSGSGRTIAAGNLIPRLRSPCTTGLTGGQLPRAAERPPSDTVAIPLAADD